MVHTNVQSVMSVAWQWVNLMLYVRAILNHRIYILYLYIARVDIMEGSDISTANTVDIGTYIISNTLVMYDI